MKLKYIILSIFLLTILSIGFNKPVQAADNNPYTTTSSDVPSTGVQDNTTVHQSTPATKTSTSSQPKSFIAGLISASGCGISYLFNLFLLLIIILLLATRKNNKIS